MWEQVWTLSLYCSVLLASDRESQILGNLKLFLEKTDINLSAALRRCMALYCRYLCCWRRNPKRSFPCLSLSRQRSVSIYTFQSSLLWVLMKSESGVMISSWFLLVLAQKVCHFKCFWEAGDITLQNMYFQHTKHFQGQPLATADSCIYGKW